MPAASLLRRFERCRPSSTNATALATAAGDSSPPVSSLTGRRKAGTASTSAATSADGTSSPVWATTPSSKAATMAPELFRGDPILEHGEHCPADEVLQDRTLATLFERLDLDLAAGAGGERVEVVDAWHHRALAGAEAAAEGVGGERLVVADAEPHADTRPLVDVAARPGEVAERGHHIGEVLGHASRRRHPRASTGASARMIATSVSTSSG